MLLLVGSTSLTKKQMVTLENRDQGLVSLAWLRHRVWAGVESTAAETQVRLRSSHTKIQVFIYVGVLGVYFCIKIRTATCPQCEKPLPLIILFGAKTTSNYPPLALISIYFF
jgi:hypothetical protein